MEPPRLDMAGGVTIIGKLENINISLRPICGDYKKSFFGLALELEYVWCTFHNEKLVAPYHDAKPS